MRLAALLAMVTCSAGCALYGGGDDPVDAACDPGEPAYLFDAVAVPTTSAEARAVAFDLDGDGAVDNQLGNALASLVQAFGLEWQANVDASIDRGDTLVLGSLHACTGAATFATHEGSDPSPSPCIDPDDPLTCRQHLDGNGRFDASAAAPGDGVRGTLVDGGFEGGDEPGLLRLSLVLIEGDPATLELALAHARFAAVSATALDDGAIGGAVALAAVLPALRLVARGMIARDCVGSSPPCGCVSSSFGDYMQDILDLDDDCDVTAEEFETNSYIQSLFAPDLDTDGDQVVDALSIGVGVRAVAAQIR